MVRGFLSKMGLTHTQYRQLLANTARSEAKAGKQSIPAVAQILKHPANVRTESPPELHGLWMYERMNRTEAAYSGYLESLRVAGLISWWGFETIKLRLANRTYYTPDFTVVRTVSIEFHEVKGFWREDARVKFKVAAEQFPWARFIVVRKDGESWQAETVGQR